MVFKLDYLFKDGSYRTTEKERPLVSKLFPTLYFYIRILSLVYGGHKKAIRGEYDNTAWVYSSFWALDIIERSGIKVNIDGIKNLTSFEGPAVFVGNHMSTAETFLLPSIISSIKPMTFVLKESLLKIPFFKDILNAIDPIVVTRDNPREDFKIVMEKGVEKLAKGISVTIFPQTTRTPVFDEKQFNSMGVKLAKKAGVPLIPIALKTDAWTNGKIIKDFGKIRPELDMKFLFGKPIKVEGRGDEEHREVIEFIKTHLKEWGCQVVDR
ncbi:MAG: 1-acyl-sn-glycerol-3-phosphate acyltransferase [Deferribacterales bacterium]